MARIVKSTEQKRLEAAARTRTWAAKNKGRLPGPPNPHTQIKKKQELLEAVTSKGGSLDEPEWLGTKHIHWVTCSDGHRWKMTAGALKQGQWCKVCPWEKIPGRVKPGAPTGPRPPEKLDQNRLEVLRVSVESRGGKLNATLWTGSKDKYEVLCSEGHTWKSTANNLLWGYWCPKCAHLEVGSYRKLDISEIHEYAKNKGGRCLTSKWINSTTPISWECSNGHLWSVPFGTMKSKNQWCGACSGNIRLTVEACRELARSRDGECLSDTYVNQGAHLRWRCHRGHEWSASYNNVGHPKNPTWCPTCVHQTSRAETDVYQFVKALFPDAQQGPRKLLKTRQFQLDIWIPSIRKAIEFDGSYWHSFPDAIRRDAEKNIQCKDANIALLRISETEWDKDRLGQEQAIKHHLEIE